MRKQDRLVMLIQSLTPSEKKHFVQTAKADGNAKSYLKLYEALLKVSHYDADALSVTLGKKKLDLANEKKYLELVLMKFLRNHHEDNPKIAVLNKLMDTMLLLDRNLPELAFASANKTIELATENESYHLLWYTHGLMLTLASEPVTTVTQTGSLSTHHLSEMKTCIAHLSLTTSFEQLSFEVFHSYDQRSFDATPEHRKETNAFVNHPLLKADYKEAGFLFQKYNLLALLYARLRDFDNNIAVTQKWIALYEKQKTIDVFGYWTALGCHTQALLSTCDAVRIEHWLNKLQTRYYHKLPVDAKQMDRLLDQYFYLYLSNAHYKLLLNGTASVKKAGLFVSRYISDYSEIKKALTVNHFVIATFRAAACALLLKRTDDCIHLLNMLFNELDETAHPLGWKQAKILFILAHASAGNYLLLPSLIQNTTYVLKKTGQYGVIEQTVLQHLKNFAKAPQGEERKKWVSGFKKEINRLWQIPEHKFAIEQMPYRAWAEMS